MNNFRMKMVVLVVALMAITSFTSYQLGKTSANKEYNLEKDLYITIGYNSAIMDRAKESIDAIKVAEIDTATKVEMIKAIYDGNLEDVQIVKAKAIAYLF